MCGRSTYKLTWEEIVRLYRLTADQPPVNTRARYNVCPTTTIDTIVGQDGNRRLMPMRWGLVPCPQGIAAGDVQRPCRDSRRKADVPRCVQASSYHPSLPLIGIGSSHRVVLGYFMCCERQALGREMIPMSKTFAYILVCGLLALLFPLRVQAFQASSPAEQVAASDVTPVGSFCRLGFHRSPYGHCVHNGAPNLYPPSAYTAPEPAAPLACSYGAFHLFPYSGCFAPACPYGYYLGPYGQCFPYWRTIM